MYTQNIVVDSSVIIKWLNTDKEEHLDNANKLLKDAQNSLVTLITPELAKYEVGNVLLKGKNLTTKKAQLPLSQFYLLPLTFVTESRELNQETFKIAFNLNISYYDATFISVAKAYNSLLVTDNIKHQGKTKEVRVIALKEYSSV